MGKFDCGWAEGAGSKGEIRQYRGNGGNPAIPQMRGWGECRRGRDLSCHGVDESRRNYLFFRFLTIFFDIPPGLPIFESEQVHLFQRSGIFPEGAGENPRRCGADAAGACAKDGDEPIGGERHPARAAAARCDRVDRLLPGMRGDASGIPRRTGIPAAEGIARCFRGGAWAACSVLCDMKHKKKIAPGWGETGSSCRNAPFPWRSPAGTPRKNRRRRG